MKRNPIHFFLFFLLIILSACSQPISIVQNTLVVPSPVLATTIQPATVSEPPTIKPSITSTHETATAFPTQTPVATETPFPTQTWTPRPTLPKTQAQAYALKMMKTNGGCQLPCWIGIIPGSTTWAEADAFLATFADSVTGPWPPYYQYLVKFTFPDTSYLGYLRSSAAIYVKTDGRVDRIMTITEISLPDLLTVYGPPSEVRLRAIGASTMSPVGRFTLVLFYKKKGFMAVYDGENERSIIIHICPNHIKVIQQVWLLWDPADQLTFKEAGKSTLLISDPPPPSEGDYIPIENLTSLTPETFYERYKDPKNQNVCMEMQAPDLH
jgi:hypothetical protein